MIKTVENLAKAMKMERANPGIETKFVGIGNEWHCLLTKYDMTLAEGRGINYERAFADAYANLTGTADKARTEVRSVEDAPSDESPEATQDDSASPPKRRRGRPRKAAVTPSDDMESDVHV